MDYWIFTWSLQPLLVGVVSVVNDSWIQTHSMTRDPIRRIQRSRSVWGYSLLLNGLRWVKNSPSRLCVLVRPLVPPSGSPCARCGSDPGKNLGKVLRPAVYSVQSYVTIGKTVSCYCRWWGSVPVSWTSFTGDLLTDLLEDVGTVSCDGTSVTVDAGEWRTVTDFWTFPQFFRRHRISSTASSSGHESRSKGMKYV